MKQDTEPYLRTIIAEMQHRPALQVTDASGKIWANADVAEGLKSALGGGAKYAGAVLEFFKI